MPLKPALSSKGKIDQDTKKSGSPGDFKFVREVLTCIFYINNTLVAVMAAFMIAAGGVALLTSMSLHKAVEGVKKSEPVLRTLLVTGAKLNTLGITLAPSQALARSLGAFLWVFGLSSVVVGGLQVVIVILGCCSMLRKSVLAMKMYAFMCFVLAALDLIIVGYASFYLYQVNNGNWFKDQLLNTIKTYDGTDNFNTFLIDHAQVKLSCCGVSGMDDFKASKWYEEGNREVPMTCCQLKNRQIIARFDFSDRQLTTDDLLDPSCPTVPTAKAFTTVPCLDKLKDLTFAVYAMEIGAAVFTMLLQCCTGYLAIYTARRVRGIPPKGSKLSSPLESASELSSQK